MSANSNIEWTEATWNPTLGCSKKSPGCKNCYAIRVVHRLAGNPNPKVKAANEGLTVIQGGHPNWTGVVRLIPERLEIPLRKRKPTTFFVNSLSDLFHESLPDEDIDQVISEIAGNGKHTFQVLTKTAGRMARYFKRFKPDGRGWMTPGGLDAELTHCPINAAKWPIPNLLLGVSAENQQYADERIPLLLKTPAAVRFVSAEPLLGPVDLTRHNITKELRDSLVKFARWHAEREGADIEAAAKAAASVADEGLPEEEKPNRNFLTGEWFDGWDSGTGEARIDWVIVGGESGPGARPMDLSWARSIVAQCKAAGVACFVKQLGADPREGSVRLKLKDRKGGDMEEWPADLRVREFPRRS